jgi:predicted Zn-dependent protease
MIRVGVAQEKSIKNVTIQIRMKKVILSVIILLVITGIIGVKYLNKDNLNNLFSFSYCDQPIHYHVDTVDPKFNLSKDVFLSDISQAVQTWNNTVNKNLFIYDPKGELSINLIYDERQSLTTEINQLEDNLQSNKQSLNPKIAEYEKQSAELKKKIEDLNRRVEDWNSKGGAPSEEYKKIVEEQKSLQSEAEKINDLAKSLNLSTREYNAEVGKLNQTINVFNNALEQRPEEGIFKGPENRIEIYFNISKTELVHTLMHELGHALGLTHIDNPNAIMYFRTNQKLELSQDDKQALQSLCKRHSIFEFVQIFISDTINKYKSLINPEFTPHTQT